MTGWVLANSLPISIFSLGDFERDKEIIQRKYPGLTWKDSLDIKASVRKILGLDENASMPPLSFMAAPILREGKYSVSYAAILPARPLIISQTVN